MMEYWIPTSEMLPDESGYYLVTFESGGIKGRHKKERWVGMSWYQPDVADRYGTKKAYFAEGNPVAWMLLPKPWEGENG